MPGKDQAIYIVISRMSMPEIINSKTRQQNQSPMGLKSGHAS